MTEYIEITSEPTDDALTMRLLTNLDLSDGLEIYTSREDGDEGSALAQALYAVPGLEGLMIDGSELLVRAAPDVEWHDLIDDLSDALRDFFL